MQAFTGTNGAPEMDANVNVIEAEVNIHHTELLAGGGAPDQIMLLQLRRAQMCFDIFCETQTEASLRAPRRSAPTLHSPSRQSSRPIQSADPVGQSNPPIQSANPLSVS